MGRHREVDQLRRAAELASQRRAQVVYIEGFVGAGKSELLREALKPYDQWREIAVVLDREQSSVSGALLRRLVLPPEVPVGDQSIDELVSQGLGRAESLRRPTVITLANIQWIDSESAEALLRICTLLRDAAVLVVMCGTPSTRPVVSRLGDFARNSPNATHLTLTPLSKVETHELLAQHLHTPLSVSLIETVHRETSGYPLLISEVGEHLAATPVGQRRLAASVAAMKGGHAARRMRRALDDMLESVSDETQRALQLLAVAAEPLRKHQLDAALGHSADVHGLLGSGLVILDDSSLGYEVRNSLVAEALVEKIHVTDLADIHQKLMTVVGAARALSHRVEIARILPGADSESALISDLAAAAREAVNRGELDQAFHRRLDIAQLRPDPDALQELMDLAVPLGHLDCFVRFESAIRSLVPGLLRQAGIAFVELDRENMHGAVAALEQQRWSDAGSPAGLTYAYATAHVTVQLGIRSASADIGDIQNETLAMLEVMDQDLSRRIELQDQGETPRSALEWERAHVTGLRASIRMWRAMERREPHRMSEAVELITGELHTLHDIPGSELFQLGLLAARGTRLRLIGDPNSAYADLHSTGVIPPDLPLLTYSRIQLSHVLFMAGFWEEGEDVVASSGGSALSAGEDSIALLSYLTWALVPVARGRYDDVAPLVAEISAVRKEVGPVVSAALAYLHAWKAVVEGEHEDAVQQLLRMRDDSGGWARAGIEPMLLLVREAHYAGWGSLVTSLRRAVATGESPARAEFLETVTDYCEAFGAWQAHDPATAMTRFLRVSEWLDAQPPLRHGQPVSDSGGYRMFKALNFLDMGALVLAFPDELRRHRSTVVDGLEWTAAAFASIGSPGLLRITLDELSALRPRLTGGPRGAHTAYPPTPAQPAAKSGPVAEDVTSVHAGPMDGLSARERQVAVLISDGWTNKEIAAELGVSVRTVDFHVRNALVKFDVSSRHEIRQKLRGGVRRG
ncbi:helix-turn-helix transcriptional regulator [Nesterenkonia lutea]|uniref:helix-turn-helix transcriptional regulator n=1 Tax=Nesterenkonia lutea TaxID=272919 RepID=UPI00178BA930|nr:LuxR C-terminal-related transcriptional regulator [Nesterenkonia lutea]